MVTKKIGIIVVLFMLFGGFSIAPFVNQAVFLNPATQQQSVELPDTNIVDYELTQNQELALLQQGKTIVRLEYRLDCRDCLEARDLLEQIASSNQFSDQIIVEEILSSNSALPKINIIGFAIAGNQLGLAQESFQEGNVTQDNIVGSLCNLMLQPPAQCALRNA